jgi:hypothetical protein
VHATLLSQLTSTALQSEEEKEKEKKRKKRKIRLMQIFWRSTSMV